MSELDLQVLVQQLAALGAVALAAGWLTARFMLRRRRGACGGDCSRCTGASGGPSTCAAPTHGVRPAGLRVLQPSSENLRGPADV